MPELDAAPSSWEAKRQAWSKKRPRWEDGRSIWEDFDNVQPGGLMPAPPAPPSKGRSTKRVQVIPIPKPPMRGRVVSGEGDKAVLVIPATPSVDAGFIERLEREAIERGLWTPGTSISFHVNTHEVIPATRPTTPERRKSRDLDLDMDFGTPLQMPRWSTQWSPSTTEGGMDREGSESELVLSESASDVDSFISGYYVP